MFIRLHAAFSMQKQYVAVSNFDILAAFLVDL
jgi:hypothetical protein